MMRTAFKTALVVCMGIILASSLRANAESTYTTVASTTFVDGSPKDGDIISYDPTTNSYSTSRIFADEMMYGVVDLNPVLYLKNENGDSATGTPVVRYGEVNINVSTAGGIIHAGDLVTSSNIPGVGQRVDRDEGAYVLGFALQDMTGNGETYTSQEGKTVSLGKVLVALRIGPYVSRDGAAFVASGTVNGLASLLRDGSTDTIDYFKVFRYALGALVALTAVVIASRRFGDTFSQSVISIGRNPLAQSHIRSMVLWNTFLILVICAVGLGVGAAIILVP